MCNKEITINKETNNLKRPVTVKIVFAAIISIIVVIGPHILNINYPNNELLQSIVNGNGWYIYLGGCLIVAAVLDFMYFKKKK